MVGGLVASCHDVSEGGVAVAVAEMCIAGDKGADVTALPHADPVVALFAESSGRLVVEVAPDQLDAFVDAMQGDALVIGTVNSEPALTLHGGPTLVLDDLRTAFGVASSTVDTPVSP